MATPAAVVEHAPSTRSVDNVEKECEALESCVSRIGDEWAKSAAARCWMLGMRDEPSGTQPCKLALDGSQGQHGAAFSEWRNLLGLIALASFARDEEELAC